MSAPALVDAQAIIDRAQLGDLQRRFSEHVSDLPIADSDTAETRAGIASIPRLFTDFLGWPVGFLAGWDGAHALPDSLSVALPEFQETLRPTYAVANPHTKDGASPWLLLVQVHPATANLDKAAPGSERGWHASPAKKFERLLRETQVPIGLLTNGTHIRLVYAPPKENSGAITFPVGAMSEVSGRLILGAFHLLLGSWALFNAPSDARLPALLQRSRDYQASVSEILAEQVLQALYELLRGFENADERTKGALLRELTVKHPEDIYGGLVTVLLRLVFTLFAEDRGLLPSSGLYVQHYAVRGLFERLRADAERYPDTMDHRFGAWAQLLALFRLIYGGCDHPDLTMPAREGHLFDPNRYPFLEGRAHASEPITALPLVSDGVLHRILEKLCILKGERVSYRTLDVEEIGSVYQTIMGFGVEVVAGTAIALKGKRKKGSVPAAAVVDLEFLLKEKPADRLKMLVDQADTKLTGETEKRVKGASTVDDLLVALDRRIDLAATPAPVGKNGLVLQPNDERRRSGSHYTPRSFTAPIVRKALEPIIARLGKPPTPDQILELKVADIAVGSAAFLVEACRQLSDTLVRAWRIHGGRPPVPPDETEELLAMRLIAQRCIYGVDRNPMAVDLAKLSLWLATLAKDHPFTFLDHNIRCGDSLVGLTQKQIEAFTWEEKTAGKQRILGQDFLERRIKAATSYRREILEAGDYILPALKSAKLRLADEALDEVRFGGDLIVAAFFFSEKDKARVGKLQELRERYVACHAQKIFDPALKPLEAVTALRSGAKAIWPFHWAIEFPEVFHRENPGFDALVGNPPFIGGRRIRGALGPAYLDWLGHVHEEASGNADLVAHFFRRGFGLLRNDGCMGLIATNTIGQGDTRSTGLRWICTKGGTIYAARRRYKWPGQAAVIVSVVWLTRAQVAGPFELDEKPVPTITAYLFHAGTHENPARLSPNVAQSFQGTIILGMGFTFDDTAVDDGANPLSEMRRVVAKDKRNEERIFPFIGGSEVNDSPTQTHYRYVISFFDFPLRRAALEFRWSSGTDEQREESLRSGTVPIDYPNPVAADWPDLLEIVEQKVKPERTRRKADGSFVLRQPLPTKWWTFADKRPALYSALGAVRRALAVSQTSKYFSFAFLPSSQIFSHKTVVFPSESFALFAMLQSRLHQDWADFFGSSLEDRPVYTPTDCFETFPFPLDFETNADLTRVGREYYDARAALMVKNNEGLTKTYNRFNDPDESSPDIARLRELQDATDKVVLSAYGWTDIPMEREFVLDYEDEEEGEGAGKADKRKKPWRYRWPDAIRDEILARLLKLNAERAEEERIAGLSAAVESPKPTRKSAVSSKRGRKPKRAVVVAEQTIRQLPTDLRLAENDAAIYAVGLVVALLSEAGGSLPASRLIDAFVLATQPNELKRFAPPEYEPLAKEWAALWNEKTKPGDLLSALDHLTSANIAVDRSLLGIEFSLQDGPRNLPPHLAFDAWLALCVSASLQPSAALVPKKQRDTLVTKMESLVA
ncbi:MAG TPA: DNA methyltransferase [Opitutaceae bacterium]|nr:DNA methyltransferase [Lacunisphaera sp.]HWA10446.1 DNA methyltransferase [Opitutaceae bacterium]